MSKYEFWVKGQRVILTNLHVLINTTDYSSLKAKTFKTFLKSYVSAFDLTIKKGQSQPKFISLGSTKAAQCYIPSFKAIRQLILEKIFIGFTIDGHGGHLGHVTQTFEINFCSTASRSYHVK